MRFWSSSRKEAEVHGAETEESSPYRAFATDEAVSDEQEGRAVAIGAAADFGRDATLELLHRLIDGGGRQAQFSHPDLGGLGQWSGGMIMIGSMGDRALRERVGALAARLSALILEQPADGEQAAASSKPVQSMAPMGPMTPMQPLKPMAPMTVDRWWPEALGTPASTGAQNGIRYASFPDRHRLAVERDGTISLYDSGDAVVTGFGQAQCSGPQFDAGLTLMTRTGEIRLEALKAVPGP